MRKATFQLFAQYNAQMNQRWITAMSKLTQADLIADDGAFFGSILGTMNHLLVGDILWLRRFSQLKSFNSLTDLDKFGIPATLDTMLEPNLTEYATTRQELDNVIIEFITETQELDYDKTINYKRMNGEKN